MYSSLCNENKVEKQQWKWEKEWTTRQCHVSGFPKGNWETMFKNLASLNNKIFKTWKWLNDFLNVIMIPLHKNTVIINPLARSHAHKVTSKIIKQHRKHSLELHIWEHLIIRKWMECGDEIVELGIISRWVLSVKEQVCVFFYYLAKSKFE